MGIVVVIRVTLHEREYRKANLTRSNIISAANTGTHTCIYPTPTIVGLILLATPHNNSTIHRDFIDTDMKLQREVTPTCVDMFFKLFLRVLRRDLRPFGNHPVISDNVPILCHMQALILVHPTISPGKWFNYVSPTLGDSRTLFLCS